MGIVLVIIIILLMDAFLVSAEKTNTYVTPCSNGDCPNRDTCYRYKKYCSTTDQTHINLQYRCNSKNDFRDYIRNYK